MLNLLCLYANHDGWCFPAVGTLQAQARISERTATRALARLEELGLVVRERLWRGWKFQVQRGAVLALAGDSSSATVADDTSSRPPEGRVESVTVADVTRHSGGCTEGRQLRETKEGGESTTPSFSQFWGLAPASAAVKKAEVEREWRQVPEEERETACRCLEAWVASGRGVPELRWFVRDRRWHDKEWPKLVDPREEEIEAFRRQYAGESWCEPAVEWIRADLDRPVRADAFFRAETDGS